MQDLGADVCFLFRRKPTTWLSPVYFRIQFSSRPLEGILTGFDFTKGHFRNCCTDKLQRTTLGIFLSASMTGTVELS